jgi:hypothetical protein
MHEVKVYDSAGKLKEVISVKKLNERSDQLFQTPSLYQKGLKKIKPATTDQTTDIHAKNKAL